MAANDINTAPIVVKKIKKGGHAHHGGSWKVAYADFVTAMMALFLLLWILETTTMEERKAISDIFDNPSIIAGPGGASTAIIDLGGAMDAPKGEGGEMKSRNPQQKPSDEEIMEEAREIKQFEELKLILEETIDSNPVLKEFDDQILIDITEEGLRVQIVDQDKRPMFDSGSARLKPYSEEVLHELAKVIDELPNPISISGHTDASRVYEQDGRYTNWELSSDRANAARYELIEGGYSRRKIAEVKGLADSAPMDSSQPMSPINRRISIIILNKKALEARRSQPSLELEKDSEMDFTRNLPNLLEDIERQMDAFPEKTPAPHREPPTERPVPQPQSQVTPPSQSEPAASQGAALPTEPIIGPSPGINQTEPATAQSEPAQQAEETSSESQTIQLQDGTTIEAQQLEQDLQQLLGN
ncbi:MAG: flagellar motor protein MotB [Gammaproteobacteria bacterium]|nr:flagellar motor protein MotB [Gammaproteobacteria bacterium]